MTTPAVSIATCCVFRRSQNRKAFAGGLWVKAGEIPIHIGTEPGVDRSATKAHLAYQVYDIAHWERVIREQGLQVEIGIPIPGFERFEFRDPFGNRVEMIQPVGQTEELR